MQDKTNKEKQQAEALSAALDALNHGEQPADSQDTVLAELVSTARLVKENSRHLNAPPPEVLTHIVSQTARTISREKQKRHLAWGFAGLSSAVAAVLLFAFLTGMPPSTEDRNLARAPQTAPAPAAEQAPPPAITVPPPNLTTPPPAGTEAKRPAAVVPPAATSKDVSPEQPAPAGPPAVALVPPVTPVPAASDTMLALANRKADVVTIDAASKRIRQVYHQGAPDEIIITQAPRRQAAMRSALTPPAGKKAAPVPNESREIKPPDKNKVKVTINDTEVTLEGRASEQELLNLSKELTEVSVANEK